MFPSHTDRQLSRSQFLSDIALSDTAMSTQIFTAVPFCYSQLTDRENEARNSEADSPELWQVVIKTVVQTKAQQAPISLSAGTVPPTL